MVRCAGTKRDNSPCTATVEPPKRFCWWHDPANADKRHRAASKAGKSKPRRELAGVKQKLLDLAEEVLEGRVDRDAAGVAARIYGVYLRAVEQERKVIEQEEVLERLEALEKREGSGSRWG